MGGRRWWRQTVVAGDRVLLAAIHVADGAASTGDEERLPALHAGGVALTIRR